VPVLVGRTSPSWPSRSRCVVTRVRTLGCSAEDPRPVRS
jgi:hypothetical protein